MYRTGFATNGFPVQYNAGSNEGIAGDYRQQNRQRAIINLKPESSNIFSRQQNYGIRNNNQQQNTATNQLKQRLDFGFNLMSLIDIFNLWSRVVGFTKFFS